MMLTHVLYAPQGGSLREKGVRILHEHKIEFRLRDWAADDPERCEDLYLVSPVGEFVGLTGLRFYAKRYRRLRIMLAVQRKFRPLARRWLSETKYCATIEERTRHPAFEAIVKMGEAAIPLVLRELQERPEHWFWVLAEITKENAATDATRGNVESIRDAWLEWGRAKGYI